MWGLILMKDLIRILIKFDVLWWLVQVIMQVHVNVHEKSFSLFILSCFCLFLYWINSECALKCAINQVPARNTLH